MMDTHLPDYILQHGPLQLPIRIACLADQVGPLMQEPAWIRSGRVGKTLVKEHGFSAVVTVLRAGSGLHEHKVGGPSTLQCLMGELVLRSLGRAIRLAEGDIAAVEGGIPHMVEAVSDAAFLTTIAG